MIVTNVVTAPAAGWAWNIQRSDPVAESRLDDPSPRPFQFADHFGKPVDLVRPENQIDDRAPSEEPVSPLLGEAAAHADQKMRVFLLQGAEPPQLAVNFLCRLLADAARIDRGSDPPAPDRPSPRIPTAPAGMPSSPHPEHSSGSQKFEYRAFFSPSLSLPDRTVPC